MDDVFYFAEPFFQDGIIAQAADAVVTSGVPYFSSAGNSARQSYESTFRPSGQFPFLGEAHDFDPGPGVDVFQNVTVPEGSGFTLSFQWNEPYFSVSGAPGAASDFDIFVTDDPPVNILAGGSINNVGGDPIEVFTFTNPVASGQTSFNILIELFGGPSDRFMKYVRYNRGAGVSINEFDTASSTVVGHSNATLAQAVGAAFFNDTPEFGTNPPLLEPFSSAGPTSIYFEIDGTPIVPPDVRPKPEIVAPDGTNTTFFGSDSIFDPDVFPNFFGTSAAAPHAAAVAGLMLELNPSLGFMDVYTALQSTAIDMGPAGFDFDTGFGLIQADAALAALPTNIRPVADDQMVMTQQDTPVNITLTGSDADPADTLSFSIASLPSGGGLMEGATPINSVPHALAADTVIYTPNGGFTGTDTFTFTATDGEGVSDPATVEVLVKPKPPVTNQVFTYSAKITCVPHLGSASPALMPGKYRTAVNVHNPSEEPANIVKWVTLSPPQGETPISGDKIHESLEPWSAFDVDCPHLRDEFGLPDGAKVPGGKGFMVIQSDRELDVVAVYTARAEIPSSNGVGKSIDVETIKPKVGEGTILPGPIQPPPDMVSWWPADGHPNDIVNGNHGTLQGGAAYAPGMVGQAFSLDGMDEYVLVPDSDNLDITGDITIDAWIKRAIGAGAPRIVTKYESDPAGGGLSHAFLLLSSDAASARIRFAVYQVKDGSISRAIDTDTGVVPTGVWTHVAGTFDLATQALKIYVNGVEVPATLTPPSTTITSIYPSTSPLRIGAIRLESGIVGDFFSGLIDEVEIFDRALSASEIKAIHDAGPAGKIKP